LVWLELGTQAASNPAHSSALSPAADKQIAAWQQTGWQVSAKTVATPAFWQTVDTEAAPELTPATLAALATAPTEQTGAAEAPPA
jgi:hypothetical protein